MIKILLEKLLSKAGTIRSTRNMVKLESDLLLYIDRVEKKNHDFYFVQVGSNDGIKNDPLHKHIISRKHWKGMFIEPVSYLFERLKDNYSNDISRFVFEQKAIASESGLLDFFFVSENAKLELPYLPYWYDQLGSFDKSHLLKHLNGALEPYIISQQIQAVSLQDLLKSHLIKRVDLLHIDTEGYDYKILSTFDLSKYEVSIILFENKHLCQGQKKLANSLLKANQYRFCQYGGNTLAVKKN
jgi:FkbM family methyltransferase